MTSTIGAWTGTNSNHITIGTNLYSGSVNKNSNAYYIGHGCHIGIIYDRLYEETQIPEVPKIPEIFKCPVAFIEQQYYGCKTMLQLENDLKISALCCLHCRRSYSVSEDKGFRKYKICKKCYITLNFEYEHYPNKGEISFSEFIDYKRVMDTLTLYP